MKKIRKAMNDLAINLYAKVNALRCEAVDAVSNNEGEAYVDTVVKILIAVVIGALILWGLYEIIGDENGGLMQMLRERIEDLFNTSVK